MFYWAIRAIGEIDHQMIAGRAFPLGRVIVVFRDLVETEFFIVIGADPFRGVDGTALQGRIDVSRGNLLGHATELPYRQSCKATDAELETFKSANPSTSLRNQPPLCQPELAAGME